MKLHHDYNESPKFRQKRRELTIDPDLSANFSTEELNTMKTGKAAGFVGDCNQIQARPDHVFSI
jgi:hypothetical protein